MIVALTPRTDFAPVPRVEIQIGGAGAGGLTPEASLTPDDDLLLTSTGIDVDIPAGTDAVTLWWTSAGRTRRVSGAINRAFSGEATFLDLEAGLNITTSYEVECFDDGVSLGRVPVGDVSLPWVGDENGCVVQQPLNPNLNAVVTNLAGSWPTVTRTAPGELVYTEGNAYPNLIGFGPRRAAEDIAVEFGAPTRETAAAVWGTLGTEVQPQMPVWLIRTHQGLLPRVFFAHVATLTEADFDLHQDGTWSTFTAKVTEISRPAPALVVSPLSYDDLDSVFASYTAMDAAFPSYSARDAAFEYAGAAG